MNIKSESDHHISVCICTYKRPQMLSNLLSKLQDLITEELFTYSVVIVDNDVNQSAKEIVNDLRQKSAISIDYDCEPEQNIALARNKAVENATGDFIAFIDDDEFPDKNWLINLFKTFNQYQCEGVLGPVKPYFETAPPEWIIKGKICERPTFPTGTLLKNQKETRTGNVLLNKELFSNQEKPFNPEFGRTGGEDVDFFSRMMSKGFNFVWCDEAFVYEIVPPERFKRSFYLKKALLRGKVNAAKSSIFSLGTVKSAIVFIIYTMALPFLLLFGQHFFLKYLIKDCDHIGKLLGFCGITFIKDRNFQSEHDGCNYK